MQVCIKKNMAASSAVVCCSKVSFTIKWKKNCQIDKRRGCGTSTSVEIPYSSLPFKSATEKSKKRQLEVVIEVWAYGNSKIIGDGIRYTNVGMYETYTSLSSKRKILSLFYRGKNLCLHLTSILHCLAGLRVYKRQLHFVLEVYKNFSVSALLGGR